MGTFYGSLKGAYRAILPVKLRQILYSKEYPFWRAVDPLKQFIMRRGANDEIYDREYFEGFIEKAAAQSAPIIAASIIEKFRPSSVIDVGCGTGALLEVIARQGVQCTGLEYAEAAIEIACKRGIEVRKMDLEQGVHIEGKWNVAVSMEVAEHLPEVCAEPFVHLLTGLSDHVVITAATPGQGGTDHVNEQANDYWIEKFESRGFVYDVGFTLQLRREWAQKQTADFYYKNVMVFERRCD